jgi:hypothetical protein
LSSDEPDLGRAKKLAFTLLLAVAVCGFVEAASFFAFRLMTGLSFSFGRLASEREDLLRARMEVAPGQSADPDSAQDEGIAQTLEREFIHPYLGYVRSRHPALAKRARDRVVIGVFGGSMAGLFAASGAVEHELSRFRGFTGREILVVQGALAGYKQPQQLMALNYALVLGGEFDIVINLDGFNEIALHRTENAKKGVAAVYPRQWYARAQSLPDPVLRRLVGKSILLEEWRGTLARSFERLPLQWSVAANLVWKALDQPLAAELNATHAAFQSYEAKSDLPLVTGPAREYSSDSAMYADLADVWKRSSLQMNRLCLANEILYFHFLQPNQYVPGSKPMGSEEEREAYRETYRRKVDVERGYPVLIREGSALRKQGVEFHDLTRLFAEVEEPLYKDPCCHVNARGNELMAREIARIVADAYEREDPPAPRSDGPGA